MRLILLVLLLLVPVGAGAQSVDQILASAAADCAAYDNGVFEMLSPVTEVDLTGDGITETVLDEGTFGCSTSATLYGGTGGSMIHVISGDRDRSWLARSWTVIDWDGTQVLLFYLHGSECFGAGVQPCVEALVWGGEDFVSVRTPPG
ncbi:hypothetical protein [Tabrizicola sp.]|uniref:hypothetical protein n=1 Tax=Tabrizicola sp. TaxID=2005166 RepID=UPI00286BB1E1|nr:hypothetical protein [Tabrizicola sp.]